MINLYPTKCNICGGKVVYTSNAAIYGRQYGSGYCYYCTNCGAYVGTHEPEPKKAYGILANAQMRTMKINCHAIFDNKWLGKPKARKKQKDLYRWLSVMMNIPLEECHFGYFDAEQLQKAYDILKQIENEELIYDNKGNIINLFDKRKENTL